jgi:hypothetical protein
VLMTASALQTPRRALFTAVIAGRSIRFLTEAILAIYFGRQVIAFLNSPVVEYSVYGLIVIAIVLSALSVVNWLRKPREQRTANQHASGEHETTRA